MGKFFKEAGIKERFKKNYRDPKKIKEQEAMSPITVGAGAYLGAKYLGKTTGKLSAGGAAIGAAATYMADKAEVKRRKSLAREHAKKAELRKEALSPELLNRAARTAKAKASTIDKALRNSPPYNTASLLNHGFNEQISASRKAQAKLFRVGKSAPGTGAGAMARKSITKTTGDTNKYTRLSHNATENTTVKDPLSRGAKAAIGAGVALPAVGAAGIALKKKSKK